MKNWRKIASEESIMRSQSMISRLKLNAILESMNQLMIKKMAKNDKKGSKRLKIDMNIDNIWSVSSTAVEEDSGSLKKQCIEFAKSDLDSIRFAEELK